MRGLPARPALRSRDREDQAPPTTQSPTPSTAAACKRSRHREVDTHTTNRKHRSGRHREGSSCKRQPPSVMATARPHPPPTTTQRAPAGGTPTRR
eukprot:9564550-Prorocentrum_lima.AAC.1